MFLWHLLSGYPVWALPSTLPGGARTFLPNGTCVHQSGRPASSIHHESTMFLETISKLPYTPCLQAGA